MSFIKGKTLSEQFFREIVFDILSKEFPGLNYAAGLMGHGSEVLGFDTERSTDHDWGPRVMIFLREGDMDLAEEIMPAMTRHLPKTFKGYPTQFRQVGEGVQVMAEQDPEGSLNHRVEVYGLHGFFEDYLGISPIKAIGAKDWLTVSSQKLRTIAEGILFHDEIGMKEIVDRFSYYPEDVWRYILAAEWKAIDEEAPFLGRCGEVGDEVGSHLIATKLLRSAMSLVFHMEQAYIPYNKWFGSAFRQLTNAEEMIPDIQQVLEAKNWQAREKGMLNIYRCLGNLHNQLGLTDPVPVEIAPFHDRPYLIINAEDFAEALTHRIQDQDLLQMKAGLGSINQITNSVVILEDNETVKQMRHLYESKNKH